MALILFERQYGKHGVNNNNGNGSNNGNNRSSNDHRYMQPNSYYPSNYRMELHNEFTDNLHRIMDRYVQDVDNAMEVDDNLKQEIAREYAEMQENIKDKQAFKESLGRLIVLCMEAWKEADGGNKAGFI